MVLSPLKDGRRAPKGINHESEKADARPRARATKVPSIFTGLSLAEATNLRSLMEQIEVEAGTTLIHKGNEADCVYFIEEGEAQVRSITRSRGTNNSGHD